MKTTIVIPVISFNEYSISAIKKLNNIPKYSNLEFLFPVSSNAICSQLKGFLKDFSNPFKIINCNSSNSNYLRKQAMCADTEFIYYNDCDDWADYSLINEETQKLTNKKEVVCFQIERLIVKSLDNIRSGGIITWSKQGPINRIEDLSVNVYSKIIPTHVLKNVDFPNLPFTQDWAISYSLFLVAPHRMVEKVSYFYYNYLTSSSNPRYDTVFRLNRVLAYSRDIIEKYEKNRNHVEYEFLKYRYNTCLSYRYRKLNVKLKPYFPSFKTFLRVEKHAKIEIVYQSILKILRTIF